MASDLATKAAHRAHLAKFFPGKLSYGERKDLPPTEFVFPKTRRYPIDTIERARDALARSSGKPEEEAVRAAVNRKYPQLRGGKK